jgi:DNA-binding response OmpR family regulator
MKRIALIEDDSDLFALLKYNLEKEGYAVVGQKTGRGALDLCRSQRPDLLVLDIMLPDSDGFEICRRIRRNPEVAALPIIFLTARASESDRVLGLELGGNDYLVKPFSMRELVTRIKIQLRGRPVTAQVLKAGGLELDPARCLVRLNGDPLSLTATEFRLLGVLMSRPGVVFSRDQLIESVWGQEKSITDRTVDVYVLRLRHKLGGDSAGSSNGSFIRSVRSFGYSFNESASEAASG